MVEILDIYDQNLQHLGTKARPAVHRDGDWHRVFHCWVIYRDADGRDMIVAQKRSPDKDMYPNLLDISAAGHYQAGETVADGIREVQEELGIEVTFEELIRLGMRTHAAKSGDIIDHEYADEFFLIHDQDIATYNYQREEVTGLVALPVAETLALVRGERETLTARAVGFGQDTVIVRASDFVPDVTPYFQLILLLAGRVLAGERGWVVG